MTFTNSIKKIVLFHSNLTANILKYLFNDRLKFHSWKKKNTSKQTTNKITKLINKKKTAKKDVKN